MIINYTFVQVVLNFFTAIIHLFLMLNDFKILFNTNKYDAGREIKFNTKVRSSICYKVIMFLSGIVAFLVLWEPLVIMFEAAWILGFRGSACRGEYEVSFELKFFSDCQREEIDITTCEYQF